MTLLLHIEGIGAQVLEYVKGRSLLVSTTLEIEREHTSGVGYQLRALGPGYSRKIFWTSVERT